MTCWRKTSKTLARVHSERSATHAKSSIGVMPLIVTERKAVRQLTKCDRLAPLPWRA
jgi:hypothetical protein